MTLKDIYLSTIQSTSSANSGLGFFIDAENTDLELHATNITLTNGVSIEGSLFYVKASYLKTKI